MNRVLPLIDMPKVKEEYMRPPKRGFDYLKDVTRAIKDHLDKLTNAHNTATQQVGPSIASEDTIAISNYMHHITGTNTINTIKPPAFHSGPIALIADAGFSLGTGGNIAIAGGPYSVGQHVSLVYDDKLGMWYPSA